MNTVEVFENNLHSTLCEFMYLLYVYALCFMPYLIVSFVIMIVAVILFNSVFLSFVYLFPFQSGHVHTFSLIFFLKKV